MRGTANRLMKRSSTRGVPPPAWRVPLRGTTNHGRWNAPHAPARAPLVVAPGLRANARRRGCPNWRKNPPCRCPRRALQQRLGSAFSAHGQSLCPRHPARRHRLQPKGLWHCAGRQVHPQRPPVQLRVGFQVCPLALPPAAGVHSKGIHRALSFPLRTALRGLPCTWLNSRRGPFFLQSFALV